MKFYAMSLLPNRRIYLFILLLVLGYCQHSEAQARDSVQQVIQFRLDPLGNCYYQKGSDIVKLNAQGKELVRYSMKDLGTPTSFDVSNPMRILIFYAEFAVIRILDNNLVDQSEINLRNMGIIQPKAMAGTPDQGIWIYDDISGNLVKIDNKLGASVISVDLSQLLQRRPVPLALQANQQWIAWLDNEEIIVFDQFGTKLKSFKIKERPVLFQLGEQSISFTQSGQKITHYLRLNSLEEEELKVPLQAQEAAYSGNKLWYLRNGTLYIP
jgi:hypothetical protein